MEKRFFSGFLRDLAVRNNREAKLLVTFLTGQHDGPSCLRDRVASAYKAKKIDKEYHDRLIGYLERLVRMWRSSSNLVDVRTSRDWASLGNGGHMHVTHQPSDTLNYED